MATGTTLPAPRSPSSSKRRLSSSPRRLIGLLAAVIVLVAIVLLSLALGTRPTPQSSNPDLIVIRDLRVPRTVIGIVVGLALALAGTIMQGITRNPLADPGLLGVNAGASLFVVLAIATLGITSPAGFIWFAFAGAAVAAAVVYGIGSIGREGAT